MKGREGKEMGEREIEGRATYMRSTELRCADFGVPQAILTRLNNPTSACTKLPMRNPDVFRSPGKEEGV